MCFPFRPDGTHGSLQVHFHLLLSRFIENDRLVILEAREEKSFPVAWALWYQFVNHPELKWDAAGIRALSAFERAQDTLRQKIILGLRELAPMGWWCSVTSKAPSLPLILTHVIDGQRN